ncbi:DUF1059 domain-containing protein [Halorarum salinum]|uniref:DUF1059 domain-containing protein n=1 Tax=Halorarum salinum TaxID=2743089 RepID=A0A7D5LDU5_9EURY|nr:DUF1059 domain-containing protein [Halobaculum salinum]QLG63635.1 DUF1059 domain-containing protein [Halobaculum salinum]
MAYKVNCGQDDGFMVQSEDESEVVSIVKRHAQEKHDMDVSDDDARGMIEET